MLNITKEKIVYKTFVFIALFLCPILVIAPLGSWVPLVLATISCTLFSKSLYKKNILDGLFALFIITFFWIIISVIFIGKNLSLLEKVSHFFIIILSFLVVSEAKINNFDLKKITLFFSISFIISTVLVVVDIKINLGLKLWLSQNFDFSNFENIYKLKNWINLYDFRKQYYDVIITYNENSYSRGIIGLSLLSLPLFTLCYFFNLRILSYIIIFITISLVLFSLNYTVLFSCITAIIFSAIYYFKKIFFKKYFLLFLGFYFLSCPFILGSFDYKKFSEYESYFLDKKNNLFIEYCGNIKNGEHLLQRNKTHINLKCGNDKLNAESLDNEEYNNMFSSKGYKEKIKLFIKYKFYDISSQKFHRLIIWSFSKEKILEKPIVGHGFFSSRHIASEHLKTKASTKYQLIPLHPHNNILQIWLELGIVGLIIFFIFIRFLIKQIYELSRINHKFSAIALMSFFQVFFIGQISFGFWQNWWLSIILISFILYKFVLRTIESGESQLNSLN